MNKNKNKNKNIGTVQVYTGDGKGKTTAALGLALRAMGHGGKVIIIQFMKGDENYGEVRMARKLEPMGLTLEQHGLPTFVKKGAPSKEDLELAARGIERARQVLDAGEHDLVILDELNVAVDYGVIKLEDALDLLDRRNRHTELVITGRYAPPEILDRADYVSRIEEVKHPWRNGLSARPGVEY
ncbi:MAG: cob(I)yrinic acid a,c-diamide adenosyltransferase [Deltaproteobacteria bacterium]|nr:cob(I)yrinic acid a,c-diamide adenosyltransferase [Deltaproteobacteria bacterium]